MSVSEDLLEKGSPFLRSGKTKRSPEQFTTPISTQTLDMTNKRLLSPYGEDEANVDKRSRTDLSAEDYNDPDIDESVELRDEDPNPKRRMLLAKGLAATENLKRLAESCERSSKTMTSTRAKTMYDTVSTLEDIIHQLSEIAFANTTNQRTFEHLERQIISLKERNLPVQSTYASVTRHVAVQKRNDTRDTRSTLLIYPKEGVTSTSEETRDKIKEMIQPKNMKLKVSRVNKIRNGGIVMEIDKEQVDTVKRIIQKDLDVKNPRKRKPHIKIFDAPKSMTAEELSKATYVQNMTGEDITESEFKEGFKPIYKTGPRNENSTQWVVEVSPKVRERLITVGRVYMEWSSLKVVDFCPISRCFKCQRFGHIARDCTGTEICSHCSGEGHSFKDCPNKGQAPKCINCQKLKLESKHAANSDKCSAFLKEKARIKDNTEYEY